MGTDDFSHVPSAEPDAEIDPHWLALRGAADLPPTYMPPAMPGTHSAFARVTAVVITAVFLVATAAGVCLTYGPKLFGS
jgi:hypothetical protein